MHLLTCATEPCRHPVALHLQQESHCALGLGGNVPGFRAHARHGHVNVAANVILVVVGVGRDWTIQHRHHLCL